MENETPNSEQTGSERRALVSVIAFGVIFVGLVIAVYELFFDTDHVTFNRDFVAADVIDAVSAPDTPTHSRDVTAR